MKTNYKIFQANILYFLKDPTIVDNPSECLKYYEDGLLIIEDGYIKDSGEYKTLIKKYALDTNDISTAYKNKLIIPGFIDTHIHYAQTEIIGSYGEELLPWLEKYTFPTEMKFKDKKYADKISEFFINQLLKNGTTTALVLGTVHENSINSIFKAASKKQMRLIAGKVMMDTNAPKELCDTAISSYQQSEKLIKKWHKKQRLLYAITPRFAPTSTKKQLKLAGKLKRKYPSVYVHTHLSENKKEIAWVKSLFPKAKSYLDVYDKAGLVGEKSIFAHAIHLEKNEYKTLSKKNASVSFCPTSNLFLGSGLFKIRKLKKKNIKLGIGTDIGAGTSFNMLKTLQEAYKVVSLEQNTSNKREALNSYEAFYQATLGGAVSLHLESKIGKLESSYEADFIVVDFAADELQKLRINNLKSDPKDTLAILEEKLFSLLITGDDRNIAATYVNGKQVY